jgi:transposase
VPRPRHSLKGRQCGEEVDRVSLRLVLRKTQAAAGDIVLLFVDESKALTHPCPGRAWARRGADLRLQAPGQERKVALMGALDRCQRRRIVATSKTRRSADFTAFLENLDHHHGPKPGQCQRPVVLAPDNGPIHTGKSARAAPAARAHWLSVGWLPRYAPELNDIETVWRDLKAHHLAHQTFTDTDNFDWTIHEAAQALNLERKPNPLANRRTSA